MTVYFGRRYRFNASHRLFRPEWDELRNREEFGKCANPHGHGHNYVVEVMVGGPQDATTGMVVDLVELDAAVQREVIEAYDHENLNLHADFAQRVPTSENVCIAIWNRLQRGLPADLLRQVHLQETPNNGFTYTGDRSSPGWKL